ncbi:MAG: DUF3014 domain-containing protein [Vicinamibacterales bacterium]
MARLDDIRLDKDGEDTDSPAPPPDLHDRRGTPRWVVVPVVAAIVGALVYFVWVARGPVPNAAPASTTSTEIPVGAPAALALPDEPLPPVAESDSFIRRAVSLLSRHPTLARWLATDALVQRTALAVEQAGDGRSPAVPFGFARPATRAATVARGGDLVIDPASHRRWDDLTGAILSADPQQAAELYRHVRPLFVETYRGMGHPDGNFDAAIGRAAGRVLSTPVVQTPLVVEPRRGYVEHRSAELRALPGISRQLLLMGPANLTRLQEWTSRFIKAAGIEVR